MTGETRISKDRLNDVRRILQDQDLGNAEELAGWDGSDLDVLAMLLTEEEYQTLLDHLGDDAEHQGG